MTDFIHHPALGTGALTPIQKARLDCRLHRAKLPLDADHVYLRAPLPPYRQPAQQVTL